MGEHMHDPCNCCSAVKAMKHGGCKEPQMAAALCQVLGDCPGQHVPTLPGISLSSDVTAQLHSSDDTMQKLTATITGIFNTQHHMLQMLHSRLTALCSLQLQP